MLRFVVQWLIPIALAIFAWVDCMLTPRPYVRLLPRLVWMLFIALPYFGALLWIFTGRAAQPQPQEQRRRSTDTHTGLFSGFGQTGAHEAPRPGRPSEPKPTPKAWSTAPDDDPEFLRKLGEQLKKDRPEG